MKKRILILISCLALTTNIFALGIEESIDLNANYFVPDGKIGLVFQKKNWGFCGGFCVQSYYYAFGNNYNYVSGNIGPGGYLGIFYDWKFVNKGNVSFGIEPRIDLKLFDYSHYDYNNHIEYTAFDFSPSLNILLELSNKKNNNKVDVLFDLGLDVCPSSYYSVSLVAGIGTRIMFNNKKSGNSSFIRSKNKGIKIPDTNKDVDISSDFKVYNQ